MIGEKPLKNSSIKREITYQRRILREKLKEKTKESVNAVIPIVLIVLILCLSIAPVSTAVLSEFLLGSFMVIVGMVFFNLGAEMSLTPMGERVGGSMLRVKKLGLVLIIGFLLGVMITVSEPDLQVLAEQVSSIPNVVLILSVAVGVGAFLVVALIRILFSVALPPLLLVFYLIVFALAMFVPKDFLALAFDSGGVTTGPMTVPFIMSLGVGISAIRNDKHAENDSFGLVALCSIGPILAVLILSMLFSTDSNYTETVMSEIATSVDLGKLYIGAFPKYMSEIAVSLLPIFVFFEIFQFLVMKLHRDTHI